jgi:hypothetical protein
LCGTWSIDDQVRLRRLEGFEPDEGTFWSSQEFGYSITGSPGDWDSVQAEAKGRHFIWFGDDELGNREWFRDFCVGHFALATFSAYRFARNALDLGPIGADQMGSWRSG